MKKAGVGFTLAEVLITLLIIGVLAALVIPSLIQNTQDAELKIAWKKAFSNMSLAGRLILIDNGESFKGLCTTWDSTCLKDLFVKKFVAIKQYNESSGAGNCWHQPGKFKYMDNSPVNDWGDSACVALNDGGLLFFIYSSSTCTFNTWGTPICGWIYSDVNGFKGPNIVGKDIFGAYLTDNNLKPFGSFGDNLGNSCNSTDTGMGCSAKSLYQ